MINIERPEDRVPPDTFSLFALGFRPFFLFSAIASVILILLWLPYLYGHLSLASHFNPLMWHAHEMVFGFTTGVIAGFLLTAARNWTSLETPSGTPLIIIFAIWCLGRLAVTVPLGLPASAIATLDLLFIPSVIAGLAGPLIKARNMRNIPFLFILALLWFANLLMHLEPLGISNSARAGADLGLGVVILVIVIMGGRVIPFFTRNPLPGMTPRQWGFVEFCSVFGTVALLFLELLVPLAIVPAIWSLLLGLILLLRVAGWYDKRIWQHPIIWVLHVAYASIALGFVLKGIALMGLVPASTAIHMLAYGGIGLITLGMMGRVSLGHTGRKLQLPPLTVLGIKVLAVGTLFRLGATLFGGALGSALLGLAALCWILAFGAFAKEYLPYLIKPRIDGRPG